MTSDNNLSRRQIEKKIYTMLCLSKCVDCGISDPMMLDFDHNVVEDKKFKISNSPRKEKYWNKIACEMYKCSIRCVNCHRKRTAEQQNWYQSPHHKQVREELAVLSDKEKELKLLKLKVEILEIAIEEEKKEQLNVEPLDQKSTCEDSAASGVTGPPEQVHLGEVVQPTGDSGSI